MLLPEVTTTYQVITKTAPRRNHWNNLLNIGVKVRDIETNETSWINHYCYQAVEVNPHDYIRFDGRVVTVIENATELLDF